MRIGVRFVLLGIVILQFAGIAPRGFSAQEARRPDHVAPATIAQQLKEAIPEPAILQENLTASGSTPFHLKARITEGRDPNPIGWVEVYWAAPDKWRRTIRSRDFSQVLIVDGDKVSEQDDNDYFPLGLQTLISAMIDPVSLLKSRSDDEQLPTKAQCQPTDSTSSTPFQRLLARAIVGRIDTVRKAGHSLSFAKYEEFAGKHVARSLTYISNMDEILTAEITDLTTVETLDQSYFAISEATPTERRIRSVALLDSDFRGRVTGNKEIIWPQVLDGAIAGPAKFFVSTDSTGQVREVLPFCTANERSNDSAVRQIKKWKLEPLVRGDVAVQMESQLTFRVDTRAWGPAKPLNDEEVRKLAANIVEPSFPAGKNPVGSTFSLMIAVDSDGQMIEAIGGEGPAGAFSPCYDAVKKWKFSPILENGEPRPYRAEIKCKAS